MIRTSLNELIISGLHYKLFGENIHKRSFKATCFDYYSQTPHPGNYTDYSLCGEHM